MIKRTLENHIKFLTEVQQHIDEVHAAVQSNGEVSRLVSSGFHSLKTKDRKTVSKVILDQLARCLRSQAADVLTLIEQLHYTSAIGFVSTTESDIYDLVYVLNIPTAIERMKQQHAKLSAM